MDPVHGFIVVGERWILDLVGTPEFQRLRRIRQLGASYATYHGAEHTRFGHCLGAFHIMRTILRRLEHAGSPVDEGTRTAALAAALLHDLGHGPLSHSLEGELTPGRGHEAWTLDILQGPTRVAAVLQALDPSLPGLVADILQRRYPLPWVSHLVSGQLDVDRMDYLLRDALFTGTGYGRYELDRIVHTLVLAGGRVVVLAKGLHAAEEYLLARYFMYWRVYLHKTTRALECMLRQAFRRARELWSAGRLPAEAVGRFAPFFAGRGSVAEYLALDDHDAFWALKGWASAPDPVLADLARRILDRDFLKPVFKEPQPDLDEAAIERAREVVAAGGWDPDHYCLVDRTGNVPYDAYAGGSAARTDPILVLDGSGRLEEISRVSPLIGSLSGRRLEAVNLYVPEPCREQVRGALRRLGLY